ncbi:MAG: hypothetical protein KTR18_08285, partial [Acidiferrobacterales bacterium]|nr:hypothetical protein [Acidiferrobacterales bacterium]
IADGSAAACRGVISHEDIVETKTLAAVSFYDGSYVFTYVYIKIGKPVSSVWVNDDSLDGNFN